MLLSLDPKFPICRGLTILSLPANAKGNSCENRKQKLMTSAGKPSNIDKPGQPGDGAEQQSGEPGVEPARQSGETGVPGNGAARQSNDTPPSSRKSAKIIALWAIVLLSLCALSASILVKCSGPRNLLEHLFVYAVSVPLLFQPPESALPPPLDGTYKSESGKLTFNGDEKSITLSVPPELAKLTGLPEGEYSGNYAFLFNNEPSYYDIADYFRITINGKNYQFSCSQGENFPGAIVFFAKPDEKYKLIFQKEE